MKATLMVNVSLRFFDGRGRFVLPKILRDKMNLRVGDTVTIIDEVCLTIGFCQLWQV